MSLQPYIDAYLAKGGIIQRLPKSHLSGDLVEKDATISRCYIAEGFSTTREDVKFMVFRHKAVITLNM